MKYRQMSTREVFDAKDTEDALKQIHDKVSVFSKKIPRIVTSPGGHEVYVYFDDRFDRQDYAWSIGGSY